jgi:hypothetical protein
MERYANKRFLQETFNCRGNTASNKMNDEKVRTGTEALVDHFNVQSWNLSGESKKVWIDVSQYGPQRNRSSNRVPSELNSTSLPPY